MSKIYTKKGDSGITSLLSGEKVKKNNIQVELYGSLDELNSFLGAIISSVSDKEVKDEIMQIQEDLFIMSSWIASSSDSKFLDYLSEIDDQDLQRIENLIDKIFSKIEPLKVFVLPGGHISSSFAHISRSVCRRCERLFISYLDIAKNLKDDYRYKNFLAYINRLSDYLFALALYLNKIHSVENITWKNQKKKK